MLAIEVEVHFHIICFKKIWNLTSKMVCETKSLSKSMFGDLENKMGEVLSKILQTHQKQVHK